MRAGDCINFTGIQHERCAAGVRYQDVRDASAGPYRWPCHAKSLGCATSCASFVAMTKEQEVAEDASMDAVVEKWLAGVSPCCDAPLISYKHGSVRVDHCSTCKGFVARACGVE